ncbi:hypothetical protein AVEN_135226-1 [Araneus ventricosus]|uniref:Uncharacterized protein n=1 Tax=Araneus ventricosus TaxID=182803 RepID=A0A4Y2CPK6_ARAVE|nr:hypothetical protein AVEN_135226-1 [Araneus ventricosus]
MQFNLLILTCCFEATAELFSVGPHNFDPWSDDTRVFTPSKPRHRTDILAPGHRDPMFIDRHNSLPKNVFVFVVGLKRGDSSKPRGPIF